MNDTFLTHRTSWRSWKITEVNDELRLRATVLPIVWEPEQELEAHCVYPLFSGSGKETTPVLRQYCRCEEKSGDEIPNRDGKCGIYALHSLGEVSLLFLHELLLRGRVIGKVKQWGEIWEGNTGIKSQFAYPATIECGACEICKQVFPVQDLFLALRETRFFPPSAPSYWTEDSLYALVCREHSSQSTLSPQWSRSWHEDISKTYALKAA